jgi:hypothetical protein
MRAVFVAALAALAAAGCVFAIPTDGLSSGALNAPSDAPLASGDADDAGTSSLDGADGADAKFPSDTLVWSGNGHAYAVRVVPGGIPWDQARVLAEKAGGHLVTIGSPAESSFVLALADTRLSDAFVGGLGPWLGGYQPNPTPAVEPAGGWEWIDGTPWSFTAWQAGQPDNAKGIEHYLNLYRPGGTTAWNDDSLTGTGAKVISYLVEFE